MKLALGNPRWLEVHLNGALWWRSVKSRLKGSEKMRNAAPSNDSAEESTHARRKRVFFDWP